MIFELVCATVLGAFFGFAVAAVFNRRAELKRRQRLLEQSALYESHAVSTKPPLPVTNERIRGEMKSAAKRAGLMLLVASLGACSWLGSLNAATHGFASLPPRLPDPASRSTQAFGF